MPYRIRVDQAACIRAGRCEVIAEQIFRVPLHGKVELLQDTVIDAEPARSAARECPVHAITVQPIAAPPAAAQASRSPGPRPGPL